jgi:hypothetical protein
VIVRTDENVDIEKGPDDAHARKGRMIAAALDAAIKAHDSVEAMRADAEEKEKKVEEEKKDDAGETLDKILACLHTMTANSTRCLRAWMRMRKRMAPRLQWWTSGRMPVKSKSLAIRRRSRLIARIAYADAEVRNELSSIQCDADRASGAWGENARTPWTSELLDEYRRRAAQPHQKHSRLWADVNPRRAFRPGVKECDATDF